MIPTTALLAAPFILLLAAQLQTVGAQTCLNGGTYLGLDYNNCGFTFGTTGFTRPCSAGGRSGACGQSYGTCCTNGGSVGSNACLGGESVSPSTVFGCSGTQRFDPNTRQTVCCIPSGNTGGCPSGFASDGTTCSAFCPNSGSQCINNRCCRPSGSTGTCPAGLVSDGTSCSFGRCLNSGSQCYGTQCCRSSTIGTCSNGVRSAGPCGFGRSCSGGFICDSNNQCCQSASTCPNGASSIGSCSSGQCILGFTCINNQCCPSGATTCPTGEAYTGQCINGLCGAGSVCRNGVSCCQRNVVTTCPAGQSYAGVQCPNGVGCPSGTFCQNGGACCRSSLAPPTTCPNGFVQDTGNTGVCSSDAQCSAGNTCTNTASNPNGRCCGQPVDNLQKQYQSPCQPGSTGVVGALPPCYPQSNYLECREETIGTGEYKCLCKLTQGYRELTPGYGECFDQPKITEACDLNDPLKRQCGATNSLCVTTPGLYTGTCQCNEASGYSQDGSNNACVRKRVALDGACTKDSDCSAAFSKCTGGKCACDTPTFTTKQFDNPDGSGTKITGCAQATAKCPDGSDAPLVSSAVKLCKKRNTPPIITVPTATSINPNADFMAAIRARCEAMYTNSLDEGCDITEYCNAYYDDPLESGVRRGYCCRNPATADPKCPVGAPWPSSKQSDGTWNSDNCPSNYYPHQDLWVSQYSACCPKPCKNELDVFLDGVCYPRKEYGQACDREEQCSGIISDSNTQTRMSCVLVGSTRTCQCPSNTIRYKGTCYKTQCPSRISAPGTLDGFRYFATQPISDTICDPRPSTVCPIGYDQISSSSAECQSRTTPLCRSGVFNVCVNFSACCRRRNVSITYRTCPITGSEGDSCIPAEGLDQIGRDIGLCCIEKTN